MDFSEALVGLKSGMRMRCRLFHPCIAYIQIQKQPEALGGDTIMRVDVNNDSTVYKASNEELLANCWEEMFYV